MEKYTLAQKKLGDGGDFLGPVAAVLAKSAANQTLPSSGCHQTIPSFHLGDGGELLGDDGDLLGDCDNLLGDGGDLLGDGDNLLGDGGPEALPSFSSMQLLK